MEVKSKKLQRRENRVPPTGSKRESGFLGRVRALEEQVRALQAGNKDLESKLEKEREELMRERGARSYSIVGVLFVFIFRFFLYFFSFICFIVILFCFVLKGDM